MAVFEGDWRKIPEAVEWAESMNDWAQLYQVSKFVPTDNGFEEGSSGKGERNASTFSPNLVWTLQDSGDGQVITPGFEEGDWGSGGVLGWYLAAQPWADDTQEYYFAQQFECPGCKGEPNDDCDFEEPCEEGFVFMYLDQTNFRLFEKSKENE